MSPEFPNLSSRWKTLTPTGVKASNYNPTLTPPPCPAFTSNIWEVDAKSKMPSIGQTYEAQQQASTTGSGASAGLTSQGSASATPSAKKGAASTVSASLGLGFAAMVAGVCIWL